MVSISLTTFFLFNLTQVNQCVLIQTIVLFKKETESFKTNSLLRKTISELFQIILLIVLTISHLLEYGLCLIVSRDIIIVGIFTYKSKQIFPIKIHKERKK